MRTGETFNPWSGECGFWPQDILGRQTIFTDRKGRQRAFTDGQKRVYDRLVRCAGRDGFCFPSHEFLAKDLGKSARQVRRDITSLEEAGLIGHRWREGRRSNVYVFLWHAMFDEFERTSTSAQLNGQDGFERTPTSAQTEKPDELERTHLQFERTSTSILSGRGRPPKSSVKAIKQESERRAEPSSPGLSTGNEPPDEPARPLPASLDFEPPEPNPESGRLPAAADLGEQPGSRTGSELQTDCAEVGQIRKALTKATGKPCDAGFARELLDLAKQHGSDARGLCLWISQTAMAKRQSRRPVNSNGFFRTALPSDFPAWLELVSCEHGTPDGSECEQCRSAEAKARSAAEAAEREETSRKRAERIELRNQLASLAMRKGWQEVFALDCPTCAGFGRDPQTEETCSCPAGKEFVRRQQCRRCGNTGVIDAPDKKPTDPPLLMAWCTCSHAMRARTADPDSVDRNNRAIRERYEQTNVRVEAARKKPDRHCARCTGTGAIQLADRIDYCPCTGGGHIERAVASMEASAA